MKNSLPKKLKPLFKSLPIDVVYLYGSQAQGQADQLSDYDFGVLFKEELSAKKRFDLRLALFSEIAKKIGISEDKIDVVDLEEAPILLQFNIILGKVIYCQNENRRIGFETYVMAKYHDEHYYLDRYFQETLAKIKKGEYFDRQISYP